MAITKHVQHVKSNQTVTTTVDNVDIISPKLPSYNDLKDGEIAVNYHKGYETLSIRNDDNGIVTFPNSNAIADMQEVYITDILGGSLGDLTIGVVDGTSSSNLYSYTTLDFNDLKNAINNEKVVLFRFKNESRIAVPIQCEYVPVSNGVNTEYISVALLKEPISGSPEFVSISLYANKASNEAVFYPYDGISYIDVIETDPNVLVGTNYYMYYSQTSPLWTAIIAYSTIVVRFANNGDQIFMPVYDVDENNGTADMRGIYVRNNKIYIADGTLNTTDMEFNCTMTEYTSKVQSITTYQSSTPVAVNDTHDQAISKLIKIISDNETTTSKALTELHDEKADTEDLADVAFSGSYNDLEDTPTIPTVNNATLTIQKEGTTVNTFTANASSDVTVNIVETDPIFGASVASGITSTDVSNWNGKQDALTFDSTPTANSTNPVTSQGIKTYVDTAINNLPEPMVFKGSLGTGGTITALPTNGSANVGDTYKVITAGTYANTPADEGDTFICLTKTSNANTWELIPSGDEPSGTVTSVGMTVPTGLEVSGTPVTSSGTLAVTFASGYSIPTTTKQGEWDNKQDALTFDTTPTANSTNPVTSGGIKTYVDNGDKVQTITTYQTSTPVAVNDTHDQAISKLIKIIDDNEEATAAALTDLNDNKVESEDLADVAFSGDYDDLINKPTISDTYVCNLTNIADLVPFYEQNDSATQTAMFQGIAQVTAAEYNGIINAYNDGKRKFIFPYVTQDGNINYIFNVVDYNQSSGTLKLTMTSEDNMYTVLMQINSEGIITQYSKYGRIISFSILPNTTGTFNCAWYGSALKKVYDTITCAVAMGGAVSIYVSDGGSNTNIATLDGVNINYDQTSDSNILYLNGSYLGSNGKIYDLKWRLTDDDSDTNGDDTLTVTERAEASLMVEIEYVDDSWDSENRFASYEVTTDISLEDLVTYIKEGRNVIIRDVTEGTAYEDDNMDYTPPEYWNNVYVDYDSNVLADYSTGFGAYDDIQSLYFWYDDNEDKIFCDYYIGYSIDNMIQESVANVESQIEHEKYLNVTNYSVNASTGVITGTKSLVNTTDYTEITKIILKTSTSNEVYYLTNYSRNIVSGKQTLILESESGKTIKCEVTPIIVGNTQSVTLTQTINTYITGITLDSTAQTVSNGVVDLDLSEYGDNVWYDSTNKRIYLRHGNSNLNYIDATDFIKDGMVDTVTVGNGTGNNAGVTCLIITFNTDAGKSNIELPISQIFNASNYYTSSEVDNLLPSAGTGLTEDANHTFNHTNSVTANTNNVFKTFTYDAQGHITAGTDASEIDFTSLMEVTLSSSFLNRCATNYTTGAVLNDSNIDYDHTNSVVSYTTLPYRTVTPETQMSGGKL